MKRFLLSLIPLLLLGCRLLAQQVNASSKITNVTVFRSLARETRTSLVNLPAGNVDVVISGVTTQMLDQSIQVAVKGDAVLLSATVRTNYFDSTAATAPDPKALKLQDSIRVLSLALRWIAEERSVHTGEFQLVNDLLHSVVNQKEAKPADLSACADIYRARMSDLKKKLFDLQLGQESIDARLAKHKGQLAEMGPKAKNPVKEIVLTFWSEIPGVDQIKCNYLVNSAGWVPMYDLNVENTSKPVEITYKASIFQTTGNDWSNVDINVSTYNPSMNNDRPILHPHYVDYVNYALQRFGSEANSMYVATPTADSPPALPDFASPTSDPDAVQMQYSIGLKQTILADGKQHICKLQHYSVPATYRYHTVPKLEAAAFLLARITDYGKYNLLPGQANVFFGETYIGQVELNPQVTGDTLLVSLGRDEQIVVSRTRIQDKTGKKVMSDKQCENFAFCINVRNNKGVPIDIEILDQVPLSRRKDEITVKLLERSGAAYDVDFGKILWHFKVDPNKSMKRDLAYTIDYPLGKNIAEQ